jgi:hypothetical protein
MGKDEEVSISKFKFRRHNNFVKEMILLKMYKEQTPNFKEQYNNIRNNELRTKRNS